MEAKKKIIDALKGQLSRSSAIPKQAATLTGAVLQLSIGIGPKDPFPFGNANGEVLCKGTGREGFF